MDDKKKKPGICASCGTELVGKFCHACGEKKVSRKDFEVSGFFKDVLEKVTHLDSKLLRSVKLLVVRPGFLTKEYLSGRRKAYAKPLSLFFIINVLYFLTIGFNGLRTYESPLRLQLRNPYSRVVKGLLEQRLAHATEPEKQAFETQFDRQNHTLTKSMQLLMVPLLAGALWLLYRRNEVFFGEHLITALHFQALMLVLNIILGIFLSGSLTNLLFSNSSGRQFMVEVGEPLLWTTLLAFFTLKTVYGESLPRTAFKAAGFAMLWMPVLIAYRFIVFLVTFYSI
jgi:hypothetical protein